MRRLLGALVLLALLVPRGAQAFKPHWHKAVTWTALSFLRPEFLKQMLAVQDKVDGFDPRYAGVDRLHFNDCAFAEAVEAINTNYQNALGALAQGDSDQAAHWWGMVLHAAQDFYAHSNWVDYAEETLVDENLTAWAPLTPWSEVRPGLVILEVSRTHPVPGQMELRRAHGRRDVELLTVSQGVVTKRRGLISGGAFLRRRCPSAIELGHWDTPEEGNGLAKDHACRDPGFSKACTLALRQTLHEWCRLRALVARAGPAAGARLATLIANPNQADSVCRDATHLKPEFPGKCKCAGPK